MKKLNILTVCYNSSIFVENLFHSVSFTCGVPFKLHVVDNGSNENNINILKNAARKYKANIIHRKQAEVYAPSRHHGEAIHCGLDSFHEDDIAVIVDCDSSFLRKNWGRDVLRFLDQYDHFTCKRPRVQDGCGVWFSAFNVRKIRENNINFLPRLNPDGTDKKCSDQWDVGSDLIRLPSWKPLVHHPRKRFHPKGHVWMLDDHVFLDHMGKSRSGTGFAEWKRWLEQQWNLSKNEKYIRIRP